MGSSTALGTFTLLCNHQELCHLPTLKLCTCGTLALHAPPPAPAILPLSPGIWLPWVPHIGGIRQCLSFCVWLIALNVMSSRLMHAVAGVGIPSFLRLSAIPWYGWTTLLTHPSIHAPWVASTYWLLWIVLLWPWVCKYLFKALLSIF